MCKSFEVNFLPRYKALHDAGYNVLAYDLRCHGESGDGDKGITGVGYYEWQEVLASIDYIKNRPDTAEKEISLMSMCMGANATFNAIVTGGNRGIGLEVCRQLAERKHTVILGSRNLGKGERAAAELNTAQSSVGEVIPHQLDVSDPVSINRLQTWLASEFGVLDVLINNAAIHYDTWHQRPINW